MRLYENILYILYILGFLAYGLKFLLGPAKTFSSLISLTPFLLIILIRFVSVVSTGLKKPYRIIPLTSALGLGISHFVLSFISRIRADINQLPGSTLLFSLSSFATYFIPFLATLIVFGYKRKYNFSKIRPLNLLYVSIGMLFLVNVFGYFGNLEIQGHSFAGRINLPLMPGIYSGANMTAIIFLIGFSYLKLNGIKLLNFKTLSVKTFKPFSVLVLTILSAYILLGTNSRLTILTVIFTIIISFNKSDLLYKILFYSSFLTIPILLNFGELVYLVLKQPIFSGLLQRVDFEDIITFHGRSYLWERLIEWISGMGDGFFLGNGYRGQYFIKLVEDVGRKWYGDTYAGTLIHMHSSFGEMIIAQGLIGFIIYFCILFRIHKFITSRLGKSKEYKILYTVYIFLLFLFQIDEFAYFDNIGAIVLAYLGALMIIDLDSESVSFGRTPKLQNPLVNKETPVETVYF